MLYLVEPKPTFHKASPRYNWSSLQEETTAIVFRLTCINRYAALTNTDIPTDHHKKYTAFTAAIQEAAADTISSIM